MISKMNSLRLSLIVAAGLAAATASSHAQTATATLSWVADGSSYDYTVTLQNTGSVALNSFWYGWTTGGDNLPSTPSNAGNSSGWGNTVSGNSIQWVNNTYSYYGYTYYDGTSLQPGSSAAFTFVSSSPPSAMTASSVGASVAYVGGIDFSQGTQGDSTAPFTPTPQTSNDPPAVPSATATISGVAAGSSYNYTITLQNTGTNALNSFWYGWTTSGNNLPSDPTSASNSLGWANTLDGNSIQWVNSSGTALAPGASATFTFVSSSSPTAITNAPSGESVAYVGGIDFSQDTAGDSTAIFSPTLVTAPAPPPPAIPTVTATIYGVAAGSSFNYTITLQNTGTNALSSFWYGWTPGVFDLPTAPSGAANSLGWANTVDGNSIQWVNSSGTALAPGASTTFTFVSSSSPTAITTSPSGQSVAYVGAIDFTDDKAGDSTAIFSPTLVTAPAPPPPAIPTVTATIYGVAAGSSFNYTITLQNTGTNALSSLWYGWTPGVFDLPSAPSGAANSLGWANTVDGNSIQWVNSSGTALAPGASTTFTFVSSSSPTAITTSPSGQSVAYVGAIDFTDDKAGDSTAIFSPTLVTAPPVVSNSPPVLTATVNTAGSGTAASSIVIAWPTNNSGLTLQSASNLIAPTVWASVSIAPVVINGQYTVTNNISGGQQFFRLANP
jgi:hypothetical protein